MENFKRKPFENKQITSVFLCVVLYSEHVLSKNTFTVHSKDHYLRFLVARSDCSELVLGRCLFPHISNFFYSNVQELHVSTVTIIFEHRAFENHPKNYVRANPRPQIQLRFFLNNNNFFSILAIHKPFGNLFCMQRQSCSSRLGLQSCSLHHFKTIKSVSPSPK